MSEPLLRLRDLRVTVDSRDGPVQAVRGVDLELPAGEVLGLVGESGCGKSMTALALMRLLPYHARLTAAELRFAGQDLRGLSDAAYRRLRGAGMAMIFQNPMSALNPTLTIGAQIVEVLEAHTDLKPRAARRRAAELLARMGIEQPERRLAQYPFQFSGGMLQRAMIAMSVACDPLLLIADEPTTALDVTVQAQVLELLQELQRERGMSLLLISHDLAVVGQVADRVAVMYAGEVVEAGPARRVFRQPRHPYTRGLALARPGALPADRQPLTTIPGAPPDLLSPPAGCAFHPRCPHAMTVCGEHRPPEVTAAEQRTHCWLWHPDCPRNPLEVGNG